MGSQVILFSMGQESYHQCERDSEVKSNTKELVPLDVTLLNSCIFLMSLAWKY